MHSPEDLSILQWITRNIQDPFAPWVRIDLLGKWADNDDSTVTARIECNDEKLLEQ